MINNYLTIIEKLESLGKFKQADLVEKYLKTSQNRSNLQSPFAGGIFDVTGRDSYFTQQYGTFTPSILSGQQSRAFDPNNITIAQLTPSELQKYKFNPEFRMQFTQNALEKANSFSQGAQAASFVSHLKVIDTVLYANLSSGVNSAINSQEYLQRFEGPLVQQISKMVLAEQNVNKLFYDLSNSIAQTQYVKTMREVQQPVTGTIAKGLSDALQSMKPAPGTTVNPAVIQKYNAIVNDPRFNRYLDRNMFVAI